MNLTLGDTKSRTMRIENFSLQAASNAAVGNIVDLQRMIEWNAENGVRFFRMPTEIFPYQDHPKLGYTLDRLPDYQTIRRMLIKIGELANKNQIRITCHPGPFIIISGNDETIISKSLVHLENKAELAALLKTPDFAINIHMGRSRTGGAITAFARNFARLSPSARSLVTLENDDKDNCWAVEDLMPVHEATGVPIVFDLHHWRFCQRDTMRASAELALSTWAPNRIPKMHYSESLEGDNPRAHSKYLKNRVPQFFGRVYDVMLETKAKDLALLDYLRRHG